MLRSIFRKADISELISTDDDSIVEEHWFVVCVLGFKVVRERIGK